ncbi:Mlo-like protein [Thalictrum thalictroides]|uniref:Mlo-like protein n=1 Tax=Thalictrum thalictroides TaxID=46969 RepID=A0A7J6WIZ4_THATH|nr:Mlo-like protein [Thalictrum thalictroides]
MAGEEGEEITTLERTPTWAVAIVCLILIIISTLIDHIIHFLSKFFRKRRKSLYQALYKIQSELMLYGFLSLLLTITKKPITKICIPRSAADAFLPCKFEELSSAIEEETFCHKQGKVSLLSEKGLNQLQILIFVLAFYHVVSCVLTFGLGMAKMRRWEAWEEETRTLEYQVSNDPRRFRLTKQTTFAQRHIKFWSEHRLLRWPVCFFRQFIGSVSKTDYTTLRHGFIMAHLAEGSDFNFQNYLKRTLDTDLQVVVGVSKASVILGTLVVKPHDNLFWFSRPQLLLYLMHFILFQNSFQLAFFTWTWYKFGLRSCYHRKTEDIVIRMAVGMIVQYLSGYVTLPLYALVTQMGSSMKKAMFTEQVIVGLNRWHNTAKENVTAGKTTLF